MRIRALRGLSPVLMTLVAACSSGPSGPSGPRSESGAGASTSTAPDAGTAPPARESSVSIPGHEETLLVSGWDDAWKAHYRIARIGARSSVQDIANEPARMRHRRAVVRRKIPRPIGRRQALSTIDPATASVVASVDLAVAEPHAFTVSESGSLFVTSEADAAVHEVDIATGRELRAVIVESPPAGTTTSLNTVEGVGDSLIVYLRRQTGSREARGAVAFLDRGSLAVNALVELEGVDPDSPVDPEHPDTP